MISIIHSIYAAGRHAAVFTIRTVSATAQTALKHKNMLVSIVALSCLGLYVRQFLPPQNRNRRPSTPPPPPSPITPAPAALVAPAPDRAAAVPGLPPRIGAALNPTPAHYFSPHTFPLPGLPTAPPPAALVAPAQAPAAAVPWLPPQTRAALNPTPAHYFSPYTFPLPGLPAAPAPAAPVAPAPAPAAAARAALGSLTRAYETAIDSDLSTHFTNFLVPFKGSELASSFEESAFLLQWMEHLSHVMVHKSSATTQSQFKSQIRSYLELARTNPDFKKSFFASLSEASTNCGDRIIFYLIGIDLQYQIQEALQTKNPTLLRHLLINGVFTLNILEDCATKRLREITAENIQAYIEGKATATLTHQLLTDRNLNLDWRTHRDRAAAVRTWQARGEIEEKLGHGESIETYLYFPAQLRAPLAIPIQAEIFYACSSGVTAAHLTEAETLVRTQRERLTECDEFLIQRTDWQACLQAQFPDAYAALETQRTDLLDTDLVLSTETWELGLLDLTRRLRGATPLSAEKLTARRALKADEALARSLR